jgi:hypothetical protein
MNKSLNYPKSWSEAVETGNRFYYTGNPCVRGHDSKRYTSNKSCFVCTRSHDGESNRRHKEKADANWTEHQLKRRNREYKRLYGITFLQYRNMVMLQGYKCALCGLGERFMEVDDWKKKGYLGDLHVDHCHTTGRVRGALCKNCNMSIGTLHNRKLLTKAISYIEGG